MNQQKTIDLKNLIHQVHDLNKHYLIELSLCNSACADFSNFGDTSYIINGKTWVNNHVHVLKCNKINIHFLKEVINYLNLELYVSGTTRKKLTKGNLSKIIIPLPSNEEQLKIIQIVNKFDAYNQNIQSFYLNTKNLRNKLSNELLSGNLRLEK